MDSAIAAGFDRPRDLFLLAKLHGVIIGCGALKELSRDEAQMTWLFVASSHRGSGLAARLFERAHALVYTTAVLDVNWESARAIRFYEKQGMDEFIPTPHPRWLESAPEELQYARYFRKRVGPKDQ
jgi:ribosomal protein S18 acetylase RimI-like enzyme